MLVLGCRANGRTGQFSTGRCTFGPVELGIGLTSCQGRFLVSVHPCWNRWEWSHRCRVWIVLGSAHSPGRSWCWDWGLRICVAKILTLWERLYRKFLIQRQLGKGRPRSSSLVTSPLEIIVLKAELKSTKSSRTYFLVYCHLEQMRNYQYWRQK